METALIPSHLKTQFVAPIYKKGDKTYPAYYPHNLFDVTPDKNIRKSNT